MASGEVDREATTATIDHSKSKALPSVGLLSMQPVKYRDLGPDVSTFTFQHFYQIKV